MHECKHIKREGASCSLNNSCKFPDCLADIPCMSCEKPTNGRVVINRLDKPLCAECGKEIFLHLAKAYAQNKTVWDVGSRQVRQPVEQHPEIAAEVLNYLYKTKLRSKRPDYKPDKVPANFLRLTSARVNDGATAIELKAVCKFKYDEWIIDKFMKKFIRADTLFTKGNFDKYLAENVHRIGTDYRVNDGRQREIIKELNSYGARGMANEETDKLATELLASGYNNKIFLNQYLIEKI